MCGRFAFYSPHEAVVRWFGVEGPAPALRPRWNIAPTSDVAVLRADAAARRTLTAMHWGLLPSWAKPEAAAHMINARAETLAEKPAFRVAFRRRRGAVLADAYYEWRAEADGKQPYAVRPVDGVPFALAALWESRPDPEVGELLSCTIVTRESDGPLRELHPRMPVALARDALATWLDPGVTEGAALAPLLAGPPVGVLVDPISRRVNNPRHDGPELLHPRARPASAGPDG
jgi:putative SOS response-associated peptidase YedK